MKKGLLWKKSILILLAFVLLLGQLPINAIEVYAEGTDTRQAMEVDIVSASPGSCNVVYSIKGIKYESDKAGSRINEMAWNNMSSEERKTVMNAYGWCIDRRKSDFGDDCSGKMADWYNVQGGWKQASEAFEKKLMQKYEGYIFEEYSDINAHYARHYKPNIAEYALDRYPEVKALYDEQMTILSWEKSAYDAITNAVTLRQKTAILSTSGDMIQLITDRVLVPNITVSGTGGFTTSIATEIFGYAASITGCMDNVINNVVGERTTSSDASLIINEMSTALQLNEKILQKCDEKLASLKEEIESRYSAWQEYYESEEKLNQEEWDRDFAPCEDETKIKNLKPDQSIVDTLNSYERRLKQYPSDSPAYQNLYNEYVNYYESQKAAATAEMNNWNTTYLALSKKLSDSIPKSTTIYDQDAWDFANGYGPYYDFKMSLEKYQRISNVINEHIDTNEEVLAANKRLYPQAIKDYSDAMDAYIPVLSKMLVFNDNAYYDNKTYSEIRFNYGACLISKKYEVEDKRELANYRKRLAIYETRYQTYNKDLINARNEYLKYQTEYIKASENYKESLEEINVILSNLPEYVNKQELKFQNGRPYLDTGYYDKPSELYKVDVSSTASELNSIMNQYKDMEGKLNFYHSQVIVYQDVLKELDMKMRMGGINITEYGSGIIGYYDLVAQYGEFRDIETPTPTSNNNGGNITTTRLLCADFNGHGYSHESLMERYEQLCVNKIQFSNMASDKEYDYFRLKQEVNHLANNRGMNSFADPNARAGIQTYYSNRTVFSWDEPYPPISASEPDPYDDLIVPLISSIDAARANKGEVTNVAFTVDERLSGESVENLKDYITVNSEYINIESAQAYYYGELLTGKFELGTSFVPKIYYSYKEGAKVDDYVKFSINGNGEYYINCGEDDKGNYVELVNILLSVNQSENDVENEIHDFSINEVTKATLTSNGKIVTKCKNCGQVSDTKIIYYPKTISLSASSYTYDGKVKTPAVTVKGSDGNVISSGDYSVAYSSGRTNAGTYTVTVTFKNNYSGSKALSFKINPVSSSKCSAKLSATSYTYDGKVKTPTVTVKGSDGNVISSGNYSVAYSSGRTNVGTYTVTVTFKNNYSGSKTLSFKINPVSSSKCSAKLSATSYTYDGKVKTPTVTVKDSKGKVLKKGTDYDVTYSSGRKNVGKYAVKITLKGNYYGTKTLYFNINPKGTTIAKLTPKSKSLTVQWNKQTSQTTGYQIQYSTYSNFSGAKTVTMSKNTYYAKTITGLAGNKRYYVRVRTYKTVKFEGKNYNLYSPWSSAKYTTTKR